MLTSILISVSPATAITALAAWRICPSAFAPSLGAAFLVGSARFWGIFSAVVIGDWWAMYYAYFVPSWYRIAGPLGAIVLYPVLALLIRWISLRLPGSPAVTFCLLGGLEAIPVHAVGICRFGILDIPMLRGISPGSVFVFAYSEHVVYWGIALVLVAAASWLVERNRSHLRAAGQQARNCRAAQPDHVKPASEILPLGPWGERGTARRGQECGRA